MKEDKSVEDILKEYKYTEVRVKEIQNQIKDIQQDVPGALKAICYDGIKTCPTNRISNVVEVRILKKSEVIDELEIEMYKLRVYNRLIDNTLKAMGRRYERLFFYRYIKEYNGEETARALNMTTVNVSRLNKKLIERMTVMLKREKARED